MQHLQIGLRTLKTSISVMICVLICHLINRDSPVLACLAAVYTLRSDASTSFRYGIHRFFGTSIGVLVSVLGVLAQQAISDNIWMDALISFFGIILIIVICNMTKHPEGIIAAVSTFLMICFNTKHAESVTYALTRVIDVIIGSAVAVTIDFLLPRRNFKEKDAG